MEGLAGNGRIRRGTQGCSENVETVQEIRTGKRRRPRTRHSVRRWEAHVPRRPPVDP